MTHFHYYSKQELLELTKIRRYETKMGEKLGILENGLDSLANYPNAKYVLFGIPECIGLLGDHGTKGAEATWFHFVQSFLNLQSTDQCPGDDIVLAGYFNFDSVLDIIENNFMNFDERINACRHAVANIIDEEVETMVKAVVQAGKIPIVVGGGHNNAYPIIKATAKSLFKMEKTKRPTVNCMNLAANADFRIMEGRHSGNAFRYAMEEGYLNRYAIIGLQENTNPQSMMDDLYSNIKIQYHTYEEIFVEERLNFIQSISQSYSFIDDSPIALELDLNVVSNINSSNKNPSGITVNDARQFIRFSGHYPNVSSLHICEGATTQMHGDSQSLSRLISFLIIDFIRSRG
jgi:formiminoglutamase